MSSSATRDFLLTLQLISDCRFQRDPLECFALDRQINALARQYSDVALLTTACSVVTGAADGYGRIAEKPALTLMHLGPGFANGIANLHNARRANSPIVNLIGDHASWHLEADAPLTSDIDSLAAPVSAFLHRVESANTIGPAMAK